MWGGLCSCYLFLRYLGSSPECFKSTLLYFCSMPISLNNRCGVSSSCLTRHSGHCYHTGPPFRVHTTGTCALTLGYYFSHKQLFLCKLLTPNRPTSQQLNSDMFQSYLGPKSNISYSTLYKYIVFYLFENLITRVLGHPLKKIFSHLTKLLVLLFL